MLRRHWRPVTVTLVISLALVLGLGAVSAQTPAASDGDDEPMRTVSVSGSARVSARPDRAVITLGVETRAETAGAAIAENGEAMQAVIEALVGMGVAEDDVQTQRVGLQPQYETPPEPRPTSGLGQIIGYLASNTLRVTVRDLDQMGDLLDEAVRAGGNVVHGIGFEVSEPTALVDRALEAAMQDARRKAELLAGQADAALGPVLSINESSRIPGPLLETGLGGTARAGVPIEPGTETIEVQVNATWLLR